MALTTPATVGPRAAERTVADQLTKGGSDWAGLVFKVLLLLSLGFSVLVLVALLSDVLRTGMPVLLDRPWRLPHQPAAHPGRRGRHLPGPDRHVLDRRRSSSSSPFPLGIAAALYLEEYAADTPLHPLINVNIRNLAGVPVGRLRHPRLHDLRQGAAQRRSPAAPTAARSSGRAHAGDPRAPDRDHHLRRGDPGRARPPPRGRASASGPPAGRSSARRCCPTPRPGSSPARPRPRPGPRRGRPADPGRRDHRPAGRATTFLDLAQLRERFTALPIVITDWAKQPAARVRRDRGRRHRRDAGHRPHGQLGRHPPPQPLREEEGADPCPPRSTSRSPTTVDDSRGRHALTDQRPPRAEQPRARGRLRRRRPERLLRRLPGGPRREHRGSTSTRSPRSSAPRAAARPPCCAASTA